MKKVIYFLHYTQVLYGGMAHRSTNTKLFYLKKDAITYARDHNAHGYLIRQDENGNTLACMVGNFKPSATENARIEGFLKA